MLLFANKTGQIYYNSITYNLQADIVALHPKLSWACTTVTEIISPFEIVPAVYNILNADNGAERNLALSVIVALSPEHVSVICRVVKATPFFLKARERPAVVVL